MKNLLQLIVCIILLISLTACGQVKLNNEFKQIAKTYVQSLVNRDYNRCSELIEIQANSLSGTNYDSLRSELPKHADLLNKNFKKDLKYTAYSSKNLPFNRLNYDIPINTTITYIQIANDTDFGVIKLLFDNNSKKIIDYEALKIKTKIPDMRPFWLFGIIAVLALIFKFYVAFLALKSNIEKKVLTVFLILFFNLPTITYSTFSGLAIKAKVILLFFGVGFSSMGYANSFIGIGFPLASVIFIWKWKFQKKSIEKAYN